MNQKSTSAPIAENKMGTMPVGRLVLNMSLPMMISMLVQALYNIVDSVFVAMLSENALTAVSMAFPLQTLLIAVGAGTGVGMNALLSKSLGEKNFEKADRTASNAAFLYGLSYLVFLILGFTSSTSNHKDLATLVMDVVCIDCFWSESNQTNRYSLCCKHIQITFTCKILCKCYIFLTDWKYVATA